MCTLVRRDSAPDAPPSAQDGGTAGWSNCYWTRRCRACVSVPYADITDELSTLAERPFVAPASTLQVLIRYYAEWAATQRPGVRWSLPSAGMTGDGITTDIITGFLARPTPTIARRASWYSRWNWRGYMCLPIHRPGTLAATVPDQVPPESPGSAANSLSRWEPAEQAVARDILNHPFLYERSINKRADDMWSGSPIIT